MVLSTPPRNRPLMAMGFDGVEDASVFFARELDHVKAQSYDVEYPELTALSLFPITHEADAGAETVRLLTLRSNGGGIVGDKAGLSAAGDDEQAVAIGRLDALGHTGVHPAPTPRLPPARASATRSTRCSTGTVPSPRMGVAGVPSPSPSHVSPSPSPLPQPSETALAKSRSASRVSMKASTSKGVGYQKHQMFNRDSAQPKDDGQSATARRQAMIDRQQKKEEK